jgi:SAM-dependent methyltransferase
MSTLAFDKYASAYDGHFTHSPIGILQRQRVYKFLLPLIDKNKKLLEINCGTGEDAKNIAMHAQSIVASDISVKMIEEGLRKKAAGGLDNVDFVVSDLKNIHRNLLGSYDLLFSNFGGLNCISPVDLKSFCIAISPYIKDQGKLVLVVMGRKCLWENFYFWIKKEKGFKRRSSVNGVSTKIEEAVFTTYYYSPKELSLLFSDHFREIKVKPVGLFVPPSYLNPYFKSKIWLLKFLSVCEQLFGGISRLSDYADHYLMVLEKK